MTSKNNKIDVFALLILTILILKFTSSPAYAELKLPSSDRPPNLALDPYERAREALLRIRQNEAEKTTISTVSNEEHEPRTKKVSSNEYDQESDDESNEEPEEAFSYELFTIVDILSVTSGGELDPEPDDFEQNKTDAFGVAGIEAEFDTDAAGVWDDGLFLVYAAATYGAAPTVGDMHGISGIYAEGNTIRIIEAWYQHSFPASKSSILIGLHNFIEEFYISEFGSFFVNNSFEVPRVIGVNGNPSRFPLPGLGIRFKSQLSKRSYFQMAIYNATPDEEVYEKSFKKVLEVKLPSNDEVFIATEFGIINSKPGLESYYKVSAGLWYLRKDQEGYLDYNEEPILNEEGFGNAGMYLLAEMTVAEDFSVFFKYGRGRSNISRYSRFYSGGINYTGLIPGREEDILGIGFVRTHQSAAYLEAYNNSVPNERPEKRLFTAETAFELTYSMELTEWFTIQPDIQFIQQPSMKADRANTTVIGLRLIAEY